MPKQKSHSGTKDRVRVTKTGKLMTRTPFSNHMLQKKRASRKRRYAGMHELQGKIKRSVRRNLGV